MGDDDFTMTESINLIRMEQNGCFIRESKADMAAFQEHKIRKTEVGKVEKEFTEAVWKMECGPSNE